MNEGNLRLDAGTIENPDALKRERLLSMIPDTLSPEDRLAAAVHLLSVLHLARDDSALQGMLPNLSEKQIREAQARAETALQEREGALGKVIRDVGALVGREQPPAAKIEKKELDREGLLKLVQKHFDVDLSGEKMVRNSKAKPARMAAVFLARRVLGKTIEETANLLGISPYTVGDLTMDGNQEYDARLSFYKKIRDICREVGVPAP